MWFVFGFSIAFGPSIQGLVGNMVVYSSRTFRLISIGSICSNNSRCLFVEFQLILAVIIQNLLNSDEEDFILDMDTYTKELQEKDEIL